MVGTKSPVKFGDARRIILLLKSQTQTSNTNLKPQSKILQFESVDEMWSASLDRDELLAMQDLYFR